MVKSCNSFLRLLLVWIRSYPKSVVRYKFLIFLPIIWTVCIYVSKDVGSVVIVRSQKGSAYQKFRKPCFKATVFFHTTVNTKFVFTGIVKFIVIQKCAVRKLAVTPTCRNSTWSTEWFVLIADSKETQFEKIP